MKNYFISVLVSNYNKQKFLNKSLKSLTFQKYKNFEIIFYDDASTDNSLNIVKNFKKIQIIKNLKQKSHSAPLNQINSIYHAFEKSKGEIICLMDADDLFSLNKLKIVNNFFITNKKKNILLNLPKLPSGIFKYKKKSYFNSVWPTIFPTSCISIRRKSFRQFFNYSCLKKFPNLEIDARMIIYYYFLLNEYNVLNKILTTYTYDEKGITAKIKKFDKNWWMRRKQAFDYTKFVLNKKNKKFFFNLDFFVTTIIYKVLRCIK